MTLMAKVNGVTYTMGLSSLVELPGGRTIEPQPGVSPWGGLATPLLPEVVPEIDANPGVFTGGGSVRFGA